MLELGPIFRSMRNRKFAVVVTVIQIACTFAVVVNEYGATQNQIQRLARPSGIAEEELFYVTSRGTSGEFNAEVQAQIDLIEIRNHPGVVSAAPMSAIPMSGSGSSMDVGATNVSTDPKFGTAFFLVDSFAVPTLGLRLLYGRNFDEGETQLGSSGESQGIDPIIITQHLAEQVFPDAELADVVGRVVYTGGSVPRTVIGIVERLHAPWNGDEIVYRSALIPMNTARSTNHYLIRTNVLDRDRIIPQVESLLVRLNSERLIRSPRTLDETRAISYGGQRTTVWILSVTIVALLGVTACGIFGLVSFSVNRRIQQIGTRRALGASKADIVRYFMTEIGLIATLGIIIGVVLAILMNFFFVTSLDFDKIAWWHVGFGIVAVYVVTTLAVLSPALRASNVVPALALRTA